LLERLGDWEGGAPPTYSHVTTPNDGPVIAIEQRPTEQVNLLLAVPAVGHDDPDHDTLVLLNAVLGDGMSSRLFQTIREDQGLAYDVSSAATNFHETGSFEIFAGCEPDRVDAVIAAALDELRKLCDAPPTAAEVQRIKDYTRGRFVIGLEDTFSVASWWGSQLALRGHTRTIEEILARLNAVQPEDIQRLAQRLFTTAALRLAAIGPLPPADHFRPLLKV
jgi:predicted Zn-dependent peptidase